MIPSQQQRRKVYGDVRDVGRTLIEKWKNPEAASLALEKSYYYKSYENPSTASVDHSATIKWLLQQRKITDQDLVREEDCVVFPPLFVRYDNRGHRGNVFKPMKIAVNGELHETKETPDLILTFHHDSGAIDVTICHLDPVTIPLLEKVILILYSMENTQDQSRPLTIRDFIDLYDTYLRDAILLESKTKNNRS